MAANSDCHSDRHMLCLLVTEEEEKLIIGMMQHNDMDIIRVDQNSLDSSDMGTPHAVTSGQDANVDHVDEEPEDPPIPRYIDGHPECPFCFCAPCVTSDNFRQSWWPSRNARPSRLNRPARNKVYKRFWSAMYNRGVWKDPQYVAKKLNALQQDRRLKNYVSHRRDIMPNCVVKTVRAWLPKTDNEHYVGHLWENNE